MPYSGEVTNAPGPDDLGLSLSLVLRAYLQASAEVLADIPGGPRGYQVIATAAHDCPPTQLALAQHLGIDRSVLTYLLDDLEAAGVIERQADPSDRRARRIVVTSAGQSLLRTLRRRLRQAETHVLRSLSADEQASLRLLLNRVSLTSPAVGESACTAGAAVIEELTGNSL